MPAINQYHTLYDAYSFFNGALFNGELPDVLITHVHSTKFHGYYSNERFSKDAIKLDELCMNPDTFNRSDEEILSTLVHEMCHVWQFHFGKPSRSTYHNQEWAQKMLSVGLEPFNTKNPKIMTGQGVSHRITKGGLFQRNCKLFLSNGFSLLISKPDSPKSNPTKKPTRAKFTCPECGQNAWAKPTAHLICGECSFFYDDDTNVVHMVVEQE